jgi:hypothetical protein
MEFLAFVHNTASYEDPTPDPELTLGYIDTNTGIGLNVRRGPSLDNCIETAVPDGTYLYQSASLETGFLQLDFSH